MSLLVFFGAGPTARAELWRALRSSLRENSPLIGVTLVYVVLVSVSAALLQRPQSAFTELARVYHSFFAITLLALAVTFILWLIWVAGRSEMSVRSAAFWRRTATVFISRDRVLQALPLLLLWPLFINTFSLAKSIMTLVQPFYLDPLLIDVDRALHGGVDPWRLLQPLFGHPLLTYALDKIYSFWFVALYASLLLQIVAIESRRLRMQFLLSSLLAWALIGNAAAALLSSAGPCFYGLIGGGEIFKEHMTYLRNVVADGVMLFERKIPLNLIALTAQDYLWTKHASGEFAMGSGVSAAPSMHVATTWLIARLCQARARALAMPAWILLALVLVGSVHLGWHYAIDGYLGMLLAWLLWRSVGWALLPPSVERFLWPDAAAGRLGGRVEQSGGPAAHGRPAAAPSGSTID